MSNLSQTYPPTPENSDNIPLDHADTTDVSADHAGAHTTWSEDSYVEQVRKRQTNLETEEKNINKSILEKHCELEKNPKESKIIYGQIKELKFKLRGLEEERKLIAESLINE